jgi:AcrR family transcriptional regulator
MGSMLGFVFQSASGRLPLFLEFWAQASRDKQVWQATIAPYRRYQQQFAQLVQRGVEEGSLKPTDPQATAWVIMALITGVILQGLLDPSAADWDKVGQHGLQVMLEGLKK